MKRLILAVLLLAAAFRAYAVDWSGDWYNKLQPGYGYTFSQSDGCLWVTVYAYGEDNKATWFVGCLAWDGAGHYTGRIYTATGTFFGAPWDPEAWMNLTNPDNSATFTPSTENNYQGKFTYTIAGVGTAPEHPIERLTLREIASGGDYAGGQTGAYSGCGNAYPYLAYPSFNLVHDSGAKTMTFSLDYGGGYTCTIEGGYEMHGPYYQITNASYSCSDGLDVAAQLTEIKVTSLGIEAKLHAVNTGPSTPYFTTGCAEDANISAVWIQ